MISCYHLTIRHPNRERPLLDDVSVKISRAEFVEIIGPSGSGKSVLCSLFSLRRRVKGAKCIVAGRNLDRLSPVKIAEVRQKIGSCTQRPQFLEERSVLENLLLPLLAREQPDRALETVQALIAGTSVEGLAEVPAGGLSATERQLVGVFRALVGRPELVVLDGGVEGLGDYESEATAALRRAAGRGATVVLAARTLSPCDALRTQTLRLEDGRLEVVEQRELPEPDFASATSPGEVL